ncbi:MAG: heparinase II/III family protein, partial [Stellaceae bacterium]
MLIGQNGTTTGRSAVVASRRDVTLSAVICRIACWVVAGLFSLAVVGSIWYPYFAHLYRPAVMATPDVVNSARDEPAKDRLEEIAGQNAVVTPDDDLLRDPILVGNELLHGRLTTGVEKPIEFHKPFAPEDVARLPINLQLWFYGFAAPALYLKAYARSHNIVFLAAARDYILAWDEFEAKKWKPEGDLWGEHAIAQRVHVLIAFWLAYRHSPIFDLATARMVIGYVQKCGKMLADPGLYVFRTNHGVMQNLELLQLALAFPSIDAFRSFPDLAYLRLSEQLPHYLNVEGAIIEHSAGYQEVGVTLVGPILRDLALLGKSVPAEWPKRYAEAISVYATLRRPDGSLPRWGDTNGGPQLSPTVVQYDKEGKPTPLKAHETWRPDKDWMLLPGVGTATWWSGIEHWPGPMGLTQTFVTWSYYPPLGHKHADELSVLTWANGRSWWTSEGYITVPSGSPWDGSNAPHLVHETFNEERRSRLLAFSNTDQLKAIEIERRSESGFVVRRQVIQ